jgi:hypothetical protein
MIEFVFNFTLRRNYRGPLQRKSNSTENFYCRPPIPKLTEIHTAHRQTDTMKTDRTNV